MSHVRVGGHEIHRVGCFMVVAGGVGWVMTQGGGWVGWGGSW